MESQSEKILCAAVWYKDLPSPVYRPGNVGKGIVFCGFRHHDCIHQMVVMTGKRQCEVGDEVQGFLTNKNRFVNRKEAWGIAEREKQIVEHRGQKFGMLFSEDLY